MIVLWYALANGIDTIAFYMSVGNLEHISKKLIENGKPSTTPVAVIEWGTTEHQRTITGTLENIHNLVEQEGFHNPSMVLVGDVVQLREKIQWFERKAIVK